MILVANRTLFWRITFKDILMIVCAATVPTILTMFTSITNKQGQKQVEEARQFDRRGKLESRQQIIYDNFLHNIYQLDNDGYLKEDKNPWGFANAFYRAAHREWDAVRKADILQFLKEKQLIGRSNCSTKCKPNSMPDIIRLNELNFDEVKLTSQTGALSRLNLDCLVFDQVSMRNAVLLYVNLNGALFGGGRLDSSKFNGTSFICARFDGTSLDGVDFGDSDLTDAEFLNVDLSSVKLTSEQLQQAKFYNTTMPNGTVSQPKPVTATVVNTKASTITKKPTTQTQNKITKTIPVMSTSSVSFSTSIYMTKLVTITSTRIWHTSATLTTHRSIEDKQTYSITHAPTTTKIITPSVTMKTLATMKVTPTTQSATSYSTEIIKISTRTSPSDLLITTAATTEISRGLLTTAAVSTAITTASVTKVSTKMTTSTDFTIITSTSVPVQCSSYIVHSDATRNVLYTGSVSCDQRVFGSTGVWVRFLSPAGSYIPTYAPNYYYCGTHAPGWYNGVYPSTVGTTIVGQVCYSWSSSLCNWSNSVKVTNCSGYYVFLLVDPVNCQLRYCTVN